MIALPPGARVWLARGTTDMRRGMPGLALMARQGLGRDPHAGDVYVFRGKAASLVKILWHDGAGMSLYMTRLEKGRFVRPTAKDGAVAISAARLAYMLDGLRRIGKPSGGRFSRRTLAQPAPNLAAAAGGTIVGRVVDFAPTL